MEEVQLSDNSMRSKRAIVFIQLLVFLNIAYILLCIWALFYNNYMYYHTRGGFLRLLTNRSFLILEGIRHLVNLFSAITFIAWSFRANRNLKKIVPDMRFSGFLIIFSWFIPIASWFIPYNIMRRQFTVTVEELNTPDRKKAIRVVNNWWIWWLVFAAGSYIMSLVQYNYNGLPNKNLDSCMMIVVLIIALILCRVTIRMIRKYAVFEAELYSKYAAGFTSKSKDELIDQL